MNSEISTDRDAPRNRDEAIAFLTAAGAPYELAEVSTPRGNQKVFVNAPPTLGDLYRNTRTDLPFLIYGNERLSFSETYNLACSVGHILVHKFGVEPGDRVAISMRNYPEWVIAFMAITSVGGIAVALNAMWQTTELVHAISDVEPKVLFADQERVDRLGGVDDMGLEVIPVRPTDADGPQSLADMIADQGACPMPKSDVSPTDRASIFFTSGSTGHPKGVVSSHRNIIAALLAWELESLAASAVARGVQPTGIKSAGDLLSETDSQKTKKPQDAALLGVPLFHATGSHAVLLLSFRAQRKMVCMYKWDPEEAAALIERERINSFVATPAMTGDLLRVAQTSSRDLSSLRLIGGGGAPRPPQQVKQIDESFQRAAPNIGWGMTETNAIGTGATGQDYLERPASSGRCAAVLELKVIDDRGTELPKGERGELLVRGTTVFEGYWNRPTENAEAFVDGWFRTGDVAYIDSEGYLYIVDRIKDLIIRGGENIGCGLVEAALTRHPLVREAAVYSVPDERLGEEVGATVSTKSGLDTDELREFLAEHLAKFEIPRYIVTTSELLPRTATGKIFKRQLQADALSELGLK